jgi:hypothetical protein
VHLEGRRVREPLPQHEVPGASAARTPGTRGSPAPPRSGPRPPATSPATRRCDRAPGR